MLSYASKWQNGETEQELMELAPKSYCRIYSAKIF